MKSLLIKDTTKKEREEIVRSSLNECGGDCDDSNLTGSFGSGRAEEIYRPYIEGEMELRELNETYNNPNVR